MNSERNNCTIYITVPLALIDNRHLREFGSKATVAIRACGGVRSARRSASVLVYHTRVYKLSVAFGLSRALRLYPVHISFMPGGQFAKKRRRHNDSSWSNAGGSSNTYPDPYNSRAYPQGNYNGAYEHRSDYNPGHAYHGYSLMEAEGQPYYDNSVGVDYDPSGGRNVYVD